MSHVESSKAKRSAQNGAREHQAERDFLALGIAFAAIVLLVGTGGSTMISVVDSLSGFGFGPDQMLLTALLLNVALVIFSWRRHQQLSTELVQRGRAEDEALLLSVTDPLTGCLNRRSLTEAADSMIADIAETDLAIALMMVDIDNFKQVNDFHGHAVGDKILCQCVNRIAAVLPQGTLFARLGGDEFSCVLNYAKDKQDQIDHLAGTILEAVRQPLDLDGLIVEPTISIGIASTAPVKGQHIADSNALLHRADIAMYHAKKQGKARHFWFDAPMESELRFRSELEAGIRRGIPLGEFVPFYEQQIDLATGDLSGFEMLARWNSPILGVVNPDVFIPIAEEIGAINELSESVISQALVHAKDWDPKLSLSVNISPVQLRDPWFAQKLLKMLVQANFPPSRLEIEITESTLHENIELVRSLVVSLKNQGVRVSLDDFGTGYSSLAQLQSLPFDRIKIDRSFITNLPSSSDSAMIVKAIIDLGKGLGLPITAEGIENEEVLAKLREYGDFKGQGYLYGRPEPAAETHRKLAGLDLLSEPAEKRPARQRKVTIAPTNAPAKASTKAPAKAPARKRRAAG